MNEHQYCISFLKSELKAVWIIDFYVSFFCPPSILGQEINFSCSDVIPRLMTVICGSSDAQPCVAPEQWIESFFSQNTITMGYQIDYDVFFSERKTVKFVLVAVVKWDLETQLPLTSVSLALLWMPFQFRKPTVTTGPQCKKKIKVPAPQALIFYREYMTPIRATDLCIQHMQRSIFIENEFSNWRFILFLKHINKMKSEQRVFFNKIPTMLFQTITMSVTFPPRSQGEESECGARDPEDVDSD